MQVKFDVLAGVAAGAVHDPVPVFQQNGEKIEAMGMGHSLTVFLFVISLTFYWG